MVSVEISHCFEVDKLNEKLEFGFTKGLKDSRYESDQRGSCGKTCNYKWSYTPINFLQFIEAQLLIEQFSVAVVSVESSHCFEVDKCVSCVGLFPSTPSRSQPFW